MVKRFPLLNGSELDLESVLDPHAEHDRRIVLRNDYAEESLEHWESYVTDAGPASPTIDGLATTDGKTTVTLETGSGSSNDATSIQGPTVDWSNWTEIRAYLWGMTGDTDQMQHALVYADANSPPAVSDGAHAQFAGDGYRGICKSGGGPDININSGGNLQPDLTNLQAVGIRIYNNDNGDGHSIEFFLNGHRLDGLGQIPFPTGEYSFYHSVVTQDGTQKQRSADGWLIELIP